MIQHASMIQHAFISHQKCLSCIHTYIHARVYVYLAWAIFDTRLSLVFGIFYSRNSVLRTLYAFAMTLACTPAALYHEYVCMYVCMYVYVRSVSLL
jgi:hypothetical protein